MAVEPAALSTTAYRPGDDATSGRAPAEESEEGKAKAKLVSFSVYQCQMFAIEKLTGIVYSQPADTGTGQNTMTQLVYAVNHLKVRRTTIGDGVLLIGATIRTTETQCGCRNLRLSLIRHS